MTPEKNLCNYYQFKQYDFTINQKDADGMAYMDSVATALWFVSTKDLKH